MEIYSAEKLKTVKLQGLSLSWPLEDILEGERKGQLHVRVRKSWQLQGEVVSSGR